MFSSDGEEGDEEIETENAFNLESFKKFLKDFEVPSNAKDYNFIAIGKGKYKISDENLLQLHHSLALACQSKLFDYFLVENHTEIFRFYMDIDLEGKIKHPETGAVIEELSCSLLNFIYTTTRECMQEFYGEASKEIHVTKNLKKMNFHFHFPKIHCSIATAKRIMEKLRYEFCQMCILDWDNILDIKVYAMNKGLRMLGAVKTENRIRLDDGYRIVDYKMVQEALAENEDVMFEPEPEKATETRPVWTYPIRRQHITKCAIRTANNVDTETEMLVDIKVPRRVVLEETEATREEERMVAEAVRSLLGHERARFSKRQNRDLFLFLNMGDRECHISGLVHTSNNFYIKKCTDGYYYFCHSENCPNPVLLLEYEAPVKFDMGRYREIVQEYQDYETPYECQEAIVAYTNHFFGYVNCGNFFSEINGREVLDKPNLAHKLSLTVNNPWCKRNKEGEPVSSLVLSPYNIWMTSDKRREYHRQVFEPYLDEPPPVDPLDPSFGQNNLNLFRGWIHKYNAEFVVNMELVEPHLEQLYNCWCRQNTKLYFFLLNFFSDMLINPAQKPGLSFLIKGDPGSGKGSFINDFFVKYVLGDPLGVTTTNAEHVVGRFNSIIHKRILVVCDEIGSHGGTYKTADKMKSLTTDATQSVEQKQKEVTQFQTPCRFIFLTNHEFGTLRIEPKDRRYPCFTTSSRNTNNRAYFKEKAKYHTYESGLHFFHFLAHRKKQWERWDPSKIPMTQLRHDLMLHNLPTSIQFILSMIREKWNEAVPESVGMEELFEEYQMWCTKSLTSNGTKTFGAVHETKFKKDLIKTFECKLDENGNMTFPQHQTHYQDDEDEVVDVTVETMRVKIEKMYGIKDEEEWEEEKDYNVPPPVEEEIVDEIIVDDNVNVNGNGKRGRGGRGEHHNNKRTCLEFIPL